MKNLSDKVLQIFIENNVGIVVTPFSEQKQFIRPDEDPDFHAYRILLLIKRCGIIKSDISMRPIIYGRSKFAFYDFLIRNPYYFQKLHLSNKAAKSLFSKIVFEEHERTMLEFTDMIAYIRSPWDMNYDNYFNYMISKDLIKIRYAAITNTKGAIKQFIIILTDLGFKTAQEIEAKEPKWCQRMDVISAMFKPNATNKRVETYIKKHFPELIIS